MKRIAYLITSHVNPDQVLRLIRTIRKLSPNSFIFIHHDPSGENIQVDALKDITNTYVIDNPIDIKWGDFNQVECLIKSIKFIVKKINPSWVINMSGQDYPITNLMDFEKSLKESQYDGYFRFFPALQKGNWPPGTGIKRYYYKYFLFDHFKYTHKLPKTITKLINKILTLINKSSFIKIIISRKTVSNKIGIKHFKTPFSDDYICYGGWDLFVLNNKCLSKLVSEFDSNKKLVQYYKYTHIPSESFIHTILLNDKDINISNNKIRYVHWSNKEHAASPSFITTMDIHHLRKSDMPFARKFDMNIDSKVLDEIDAMLGVSR